MCPVPIVWVCLTETTMHLMAFFFLEYYVMSLVLVAQQQKTCKAVDQRHSVLPIDQFSTPPVCTAPDRSMQNIPPLFIHCVSSLKNFLLLWLPSLLCYSLSVLPVLARDRFLTLSGMQTVWFSIFFKDKNKRNWSGIWDEVIPIWALAAAACVCLFLYNTPHNLPAFKLNT